MLAGLAGVGSAWAAGHVRSGRRIVGGTTAKQGQFPFMAFVAYVNGSGRIIFACSGTLVSSNVVLTAGHCTVNENTGMPERASGYRVITGTVNWSRPPRTISDVSQVRPAPGYDPRGPKHDAGLLVLSKPVNHPAVSLWQSGNINAGTPAQIAGWGETSFGSGLPKRLRWASTAVQSASYCTHAAGANFMFDPASMLCAVDAPSDHTGTCSGDSGGPLLVTASGGTVMEVGVTSVGPANCGTHRADYFTAVRPIYPWVSGQIKAFAP